MIHSRGMHNGTITAQLIGEVVQIIERMQVTILQVYFLQMVLPNPTVMKGEIDSDLFSFFFQEEADMEHINLLKWGL